MKKIMYAAMIVLGTICFSACENSSNSTETDATVEESDTTTSSGTMMESDTATSADTTSN